MCKEIGKVFVKNYDESRKMNALTRLFLFNFVSFLCVYIANGRKKIHSEMLNYEIKFSDIFLNMALYDR